jgi:ferritin-like metal-binding protein YciE
MPTTGTLDDLYRDELRNLWSANVQMARVLHLMAQVTRDWSLRQSLQNTILAIDRHSETFQALLFRAGVGAEISDSIGMNGLVQQALENIAIGESGNSLLLDIGIISQCERMLQYYLTVVSTAAAYAKALRLTTPHSKLASVVSDIHDNHRYSATLRTKSGLAAVG